MQRFKLDIRYKLEKRNVISNILFRLVSNNKSLTLLKYYTKLNALDILYIYTYIITLIKISENFKARVIKRYRLDSL